MVDSVSSEGLGWRLGSPALLEVAQRSTDAVAAQMSVVLLRRFLSRSRDGLFDQLPPATQGQVNALLVALNTITPPTPCAIIRGVTNGGEVPIPPLLVASRGLAIPSLRWATSGQGAPPPPTPHQSPPHLKIA